MTDNSLYAFILHIAFVPSYHLIPTLPLKCRKTDEVWHQYDKAMQLFIGFLIKRDESNAEL